MVPKSTPRTRMARPSIPTENRMLLKERQHQVRGPNLCIISAPTITSRVVSWNVGSAVCEPKMFPRHASFATHCRTSRVHPHNAASSRLACTTATSRNGHSLLESNLQPCPIVGEASSRLIHTILPHRLKPAITPPICLLNLLVLLLQPPPLIQAFVPEQILPQP